MRTGASRFSVVDLAIGLAVAGAIGLFAIGPVGSLGALALGMGAQVLIAAVVGPEALGCSRAGALLRCLPVIALTVAGAAAYERLLERDLPASAVVVSLAAGGAIYLLAAALAGRRGHAAAGLALGAALGAVTALVVARALDEPAPPSAAVAGVALAAKSERLVGPTGARAATALAAVDDLDGDGRVELAIGEPRAGDGGRVAVRYSSGAPAVVQLARLARSEGFVLVGSPGDEAGHSVAAIPDMNGDGVAELAVGAPGASTAEEGVTGAVYVVWGGHPLRGTVALADLTRPGSGTGFRIRGAYAGDSTGWSLASAGDLDADGRGDIAVGAPRFADGGGREFDATGAVYAVFGRSGDATVELADIGEGRSPLGVRYASNGSGSAGWTVAGPGDVDGDGVPDLATGAPDMLGDRDRPAAGGVLVLFGRTDVGTVNVGSLGDRGYGIAGSAADERLGTSLAAAGDVDGDGRGDLLLGAPWASPDGRHRAGSAYVVFARRGGERLDLALLARRDGYRIDGATGGFCGLQPTCGEEAGTAVASAGDANGDGRPDALVGAPGVSVRGRPGSGAAYLVYGQVAEPRIDLLGVGAAGADPHGTRLDGAVAREAAGETLAVLPGDAPRVVVGAPSAGSHSGAAYVLPMPH